MLRCFLLGIAALAAYAQDLPRGQIIDEVKCTARPEQSYALYIPSNYSAKRQWSLILAFDPRANGRAPVVQFQAAAEKYGYIVAGSKNSRNGPPGVSLNAAQAMLDDINSRFTIDSKRMYLAGQSGGARFAMDLAMGTGKFAAVVASSAGFPHEPQRSLPFPVFGTAGTEDFNNLEMHTFDRLVTTPHRVVIFEGGHTWLPSDLAVEAIEWLELQAMKTGQRPRDEALLERVFEARTAQATRQPDDHAIYLALSGLATDFAGLRDVAEIKTRAAALEHKKDVQEGLKKDLAQEQVEERANGELRGLAYGMQDPSHHGEYLEQLRTRLLELSKQANAPENSSDRQMARRLISGAIADNAGRPDPELQKLIQEIRPANRR